MKSAIESSFQSGHSSTSDKLEPAMRKSNNLYTWHMGKCAMKAEMKIDDPVVAVAVLTLVSLAVNKYPHLPNDFLVLALF